MSSFSGSGNLLEEDFGGNLAEVAPLTAEAIARRRAARTRVLKRTTHEESFTLENEVATIIESSYDIKFYTFKET